MEEWRDVVWYEGLYEVSSAGRVRSLDRKVKGVDGKTYTKRGKVLKQSVNGNGYLYVGLCKSNKLKCIVVHRLVATAFIEQIKNKNIVNHINSNKKDNRVENLEWVNHSENTQHSFMYGDRKKPKDWSRPYWYVYK